MKGSWLLTHILLVFLVSVIGWAAWERHVQNSNSYLTPEEKVHARERQFHQDLGGLRAKMDEYLSQVDKFNDRLNDLTERVGECSGQVNAMQAYFDKYSPDAFEEKVSELNKKLAGVNQKIDEELLEFGENYVKKFEFERLSHLPTKWQWDTQQKLLQEKIEEINQLTDKVNSLTGEPVKENSVPEIVEPEEVDPELNPEEEE